MTKDKLQMSIIIRVSWIG